MLCVLFCFKVNVWFENRLNFNAENKTTNKKKKKIGKWQINCLLYALSLWLTGSLTRKLSGKTSASHHNLILMGCETEYHMLWRGIIKRLRWKKLKFVYLDWYLWDFQCLFNVKSVKMLWELSSAGISWWQALLLFNLFLILFSLSIGV